MGAGRQRARAMGITPGRFPTGEQNAITDVPGVRVGQVTIVAGDDVRTGVTAIVPEAIATAVRKALPANAFVGNGYGKLIGSTQLAELGEIETPILLTGTLSAFRVADALVTFMLAQPGNEAMTSVNPVVGETNDGYLSDIRSRPLTEAHVLQAIASATTGPVSEGCVGAGTGTTALGFKAGIGTSSRIVPGEHTDTTYTIGVLVQANFSGTLTVLGVPMPAVDLIAESTPESEAPASERGNSCMIVVATDAPVDARQLGRIARRAVFGMARVGADYTHGSGDYGIAFSVGEGPVVPDRALDPLFIATQEAVEEALLNSLFMAETTNGYQGRIRHAIPIDAMRARLVQARRIPA